MAKYWGEPPTTAAKTTPKKESILSSDFFDQLRPHIFGATKKLQYSKIEMQGHDRIFQRQLKFHFDERRKTKKRTAAGEGRSLQLQSHVEIDFESNDAAFEVRTLKKNSWN